MSLSMETNADQAIEETWEDLAMAEGHLGEIEAQAASEVGLFGDSWPGSADQLARLRAHCRDLRARLVAKGSA